MDKVGKLILVTGASGTQGKPTALELLRLGFKVRAQVFRSDATELENAGAQIARGNCDDKEFLAKAMEGVYGVFSMQNSDFAGGGDDIETRHARNIVEAAQKAGVKQIVHTSVYQAGDHEKFPGWQEGRWFKEYWTEKADAIKIVLDAKFEYWTILKPVSFMENFIPPKSNYMYPQLKQGEIVTSVYPETKLNLIASEDIAKFAAAAFSDPKAFHKKEIDLVGDALTFTEIAEKLSKASNRKVNSVYIPSKEALEKGGNSKFLSIFLSMQEWLNEVGNGGGIDSNALKPYGIQLTSFDSFLEKNKGQLL